MAYDTDTFTGRGLAEVFDFEVIGEQRSKPTRTLDTIIDRRAIAGDRRIGALDTDTRPQVPRSGL